MAYTIPTNAVNPQAVRLIDGSSGAISAGGQVSLPYDFTNSPWADLANFYTSVDSTNSYLDQAKIDALAAKLREGGYQVMQSGDSVGNGSYSWVQDANGNIVAEPQYVSNDDDKFKLGMLAAAGFAGGSAAGLAGTGGAAAGAPVASGGAELGAGAMPGFGGFSGSLAGDIGAQYGLLSGVGADAAAAGLAGVGGPLTMAPGGGLFGSALAPGAVAGLGSGAMPEFGGFSGNLTGDIAAEYGLGSLNAETAAGLVAPGAAGTGGALLAGPGASAGFGSLGSFTSQLPGLDAVGPGGSGTPGTPAGPPATPGGSTLPTIPGVPPGMDWLKALLVGGGALAGSREQPGPTTTSQSKTDPRFDPYLYGDGGILNLAKNWYTANSGPNANQTAGWNTQLGLLQDPATTAGLKGLMTGGQGLLNAPIAGNGYMTRRGG